MKTTNSGSKEGKGGDSPSRLIDAGIKELNAGMICTGETYKNVVKVTFAKGASLEDPSGLFNSSLEGNTRRAIDFHEGDKIDEKALKALIRAAVLLNTAALNTSVRATPVSRTGSRK